MLRWISGGQKGVDRIALRVAHDFDIVTGGHIPDGFITSEGKQPILGSLYGLKELGMPKLDLTAAYIVRSKLNVDNSNATLAFRFHMSPGTEQTIGYCVHGKWDAKNSKVPPNVNERDMSEFHRPVIVISMKSQLSDINMDHTRDLIVNFISKHKAKTLNIAGHRELENDDAVRIELLLYKVLCRIKKL